MYKGSEEEKQEEVFSKDIQRTLGIFGNIQASI
jgi:hypothetical protein